jgi:hypothetical protein
VLISHVLCCFSVLVCYRFSLQIVVQRGEIKQSWNLGPCQCARAHCDRTHEPRSSTSHVNCNPRVALPGPSLHRFNTCAVGFQSSYLRSIVNITIERNAIELKSLRLNAYYSEIERNAYDRLHIGLRSITPPTIERTPDLAAHFILPINRTLCNS